MAEVTPHFTDVDVARIALRFRGLGQLDRLLASRLGKGAIQSLATKVPILNMTAKLLLVTARPPRPRAEDHPAGAPPP